MTKYKIIYHWPSGETDEDDNCGYYYDTEEWADEMAVYGLGCAELGADIMEMSNPGDYPYDEDERKGAWYEIEEVEV